MNITFAPLQKYTFPVIVKMARCTACTQMVGEKSLGVFE